MSGSLNKVLLIGHVGRDPEIKTMTNGNRVATFSLATSERWKDKSTGERKERTEWMNIVVFNDNLIKVIEQYIAKGSKLYVEGQLQTRKWEKDGQNHYTTEVVLQGFGGTITMLDKAEGGGGTDGDRYASQYTDRGSGGANATGRSSAAQEAYDDLDDSIPF